MKTILGNKVSLKILLAVWEAASNGITISEIAHKTKMLNQNVSREVNALLKNGYVVDNYKRGERGGVKRFVYPSMTWLYLPMAKKNGHELNKKEREIIEKPIKKKVIRILDYALNNNTLAEIVAIMLYRVMVGNLTHS